MINKAPSILLESKNRRNPHYKGILVLITFGVQLNEAFRSVLDPTQPNKMCWYIIF